MKFIIIFLIFFGNFCLAENNVQEILPSNFYFTPANIPTPDTQFYNAQGEKVILDQFNGKIIILNFWATWCTNCTKEIKELDQLQKQFMKYPIKIVPLSVDFKDQEAITNYYKVNDIKYLKVFRDEKRALYSQFSSHGMPISVIINEKGIILGYFKGNVDWTKSEIKDWLISLTKDIKFEYREDEDSKQILEEKAK